MTEKIAEKTTEPKLATAEEIKDKEKFLKELAEINPGYKDLTLIGKAFDVANKMHDGQLRKSGEPYLVHPVAVAKILAELGMDEATIVAGLLHDVVEDTPYTNEQLREDFGEEIEALVDGVTKLTSLKFETKEEKQAENLRKMFLAMSKDIRVLIIKLSDRLHNIRTINYMTKDKIYEKCRETLDIYAPLASRLGIFAMKFELEDIAMKQLYPEEYAQISRDLDTKKAERNDAIKKIVDEIKDALSDLDIHFDIYGRSKHFYSIFRKMKMQKSTLNEIFDLLAVRVIVGTIKDCYSVLGIVHTMWKPIPGRFKDYIAMPKPNMYQSLHTTVMGDDGVPFEIQIRTYQMHQIAEYGIAAHWKYKEGGGKADSTDDMKLSWLRQVLEWQKDTKDPTEFLESLKLDLFSNQVFVFTPAGDVIELPAKATPLDFAFKIHTDVGAKCIGAKVNGRMVPIDHTLQNGDIIEIMTSPHASGPSIDWLKIAKSSTARTKIRQWLKKENKSDNVDKGKDLLDKYIRKKSDDPGEIATNIYIHRVAKKLGFKEPNEMYTQLSNGGPLMTEVYQALKKCYQDDKAEEEKQQENTDAVLLAKKPVKHEGQKEGEKGVNVEGLDNLMINMSGCCNPVPGDEIIGYITKGRGISVHRKDCENITSLDEKGKERLIEVSWTENQGEEYEANITIVSEDRKGLFSDLSKVCDSNDIFIIAVNTLNKEEDMFTVVMTLAITDTHQLQRVIRAFKAVKGVEKVFRSTT